jgi:G:T-mismatch repair DNA endonuclease (very short patch repair protein)
LSSSSADPDDIARGRRDRRRGADRATAWARHRRAAAFQAATGSQSRAYNQLEARLAKMLDTAEVAYRWQFPLGQFVYDFLLPNRLLVEVHGTYWHADPRSYEGRMLTPDQRRNRLHDLDKRLFAAGQGYRLKVVWEADLTRSGIRLSDLLDTGDAPV